MAACILLLADCSKQPNAAAPAAPASPAVPPPPPPPAPEPFTGTLPEVEGVQAIITMRHPKLVNQDLGKLVAGVPEAALLRMALARFSALGYPEFSDLAPGSNIGVAVLTITADDLRNKSSALVGFARLKEGGKLWRIVAGNHLAHVRAGDWVLIAKDYAVLGRLKDPNPIIAYLEKPQIEDIVLWGRTSPELLSSIKAAFGPDLRAKLEELKPAEAHAAIGYLKALYSMASQLHSAGISLTFADSAIKLVDSAQFLPDSPLGVYLRYKPGPTPGIAQHVSANSVATFVSRRTPKATADLAQALLEPLLAVDYPPAARRLRELRKSYAAFAENSDGGCVGVVDMAPGISATNGPKKSAAETFAVISGHFTTETARAYMKGIRDLTEGVLKKIQSKVAASHGVNAMDIHFGFTENAVTVSGHAFDAFTTTILVNGREVSEKTQYSGVAEGNLIIADSQEALQAHLPELLSKIPLPDGIAGLQGDDIAFGSLNGGKFVDAVAVGAKLDLNDEDTKAEIDSLKGDFAAGGPVTFAVAASQARSTVTITVPYKLIETSVHLAEYIRVQKIDLSSMLGGTAAPARP